MVFPTTMTERWSSCAEPELAAGHRSFGVRRALDEIGFDVDQVLRCEFDTGFFLHPRHTLGDIIFLCECTFPLLDDEFGRFEGRGVRGLAVVTDPAVLLK